MVIPNLVRQVLDGDPITVFGDGSQTRSFVYVGDAVRALVGLMNEPRAIGQVFNVGNDTEVSIRNLAETVKRITRSSSEIITVPYEEAYEEGFEDMSRRVPALQKINDLLGWTPSADLEETLERIVAHARLGTARGGAETPPHDDSLTATG